MEELYKITSIDKWFLYKLKRIVDVDNLIEVRRYEYSRTRRFHKAEPFRASQRIVPAVCEMAGRSQPSHSVPHRLTSMHACRCACAAGELIRSHQTNTLDSLTYNTLLLAKKTGFSDTQVAAARCGSGGPVPCLDRSHPLRRCEPP